MSINIGETDTDSDWNDLKIFLAVARSGTQAFAAEVLGQSQPTVGRRIRALERSLGSTLFYRDARGLGLTDDGETVMRCAQRMESEALSIRRNLAMRNESDGLLRVSASGWLGSYLLAPAFVQFNTSHPQLQIHLVSDGTGCSLMRREVDLVYQLKQFDAPDVIERAMMRISYGVYGLDAYLEAAGALLPGGLGHKLLALAGAASDSAQDDWLRTHLNQASITLRTDSHEALLQWCRKGWGLALLPRAVGRMHPELRQLEIPAPHFEQILWAGFHREMKFSPQLRDLLDHCQQPV
jgi:DNA-binding transcriptional LysR family regulator